MWQGVAKESGILPQHLLTISTAVCPVSHVSSLPVYEAQVSLMVYLSLPGKWRAKLKTGEGLFLDSFQILPCSGAGFWYQVFPGL